MYAGCVVTPSIQWKVKAKVACRRSQLSCASIVENTGKVSSRFRELSSKKEAALIPYICAGDPSLEVSAQVLSKISYSGADMIEVGIPYSDPLADGPVIQAAATRALEAGTTPAGVLSMLKEANINPDVPLIIFTYFNVVLSWGIERFMLDASTSGCSGIIIPDVPLEETSDIQATASAAGLELILLATPTTPKERLEKIAASSQGFIYLVSVAGVTGTRESVAEVANSKLQELRSVTDKPIAIGFGISKPEHAQQVVSWGSDGVIVGSALVKTISACGDKPDQAAATAGDFVKSLKTAMIIPS